RLKEAAANLPADLVDSFGEAVGSDRDAETVMVLARQQLERLGDPNSAARGDEQPLRTYAQALRDILMFAALFGVVYLVVVLGDAPAANAVLGSFHATALATLGTVADQALSSAVHLVYLVMLWVVWLGAIAGWLALWLVHWILAFFGFFARLVSIPGDVMRR